MKAQFESIYRLLPQGYIRSVLKNLLSFTLHSLPLPTESFIYNGVKLTLYKDIMYPNSVLLKEIKGYNQKYNLKKGDIVVDAGAYSGMFTIYASRKVGSEGKVISFEPDPYNLHMLKRNLKLNNVKNVILIKKGLYSGNTTLPFDIQTISSTLMQNSHKTINKINVVTLDSELNSLKIKKIDFIKMDIEGAEIEAVKGCQKTIKLSENIHFAIASYHIVDGKKTCIFLEKYFKSHKLKASTDYKTHLTTYASH